MKKDSKNKKPKIIRKLLLIIFIIILFMALYKLIDFSNNNYSDIPVITLNQPVEDSQIDENEYKYIKLNEEDIYSGSLILVNNEYQYRNENNNELVSVFNYKTRSYKVSNVNVLLNLTVIRALNDMLDDFYEYSKKDDILIASGYRTVSEQEKIYNNREDAAKWVANPGYSEHHTGYAIDLSIFSNFGINTEYTGKGKYAWIEENTYKYGFIRRYPNDKVDITKINYEPWHFRYVGIPHAYIMKEKGFCLEEYIDYIKDYGFNDKHLLINDGKEDYEIYYVKANLNNIQIPVPKAKKYSISGNNIDGFIVSVNR